MQPILLFTSDTVYDKLREIFNTLFNKAGFMVILPKWKLMLKSFKHVWDRLGYDVRYTKPTFYLRFQFTVSLLLNFY